MPMPQMIELSNGDSVNWEFISRIFCDSSIDFFYYF